MASLTDTIAQLSSELATAQAKLISSLLDNQRLLKRLSDKGGSWNTSGGVTDRKTYGGGVAGPWDGPSIHYCHTHGHKFPHPSFTSVPTPVSSVLIPIPGTSRMQPTRTPEAVVIKNTRRSDNIMRLIIAKF